MKRLPLLLALTFVAVSSHSQQVWEPISGSWTLELVEIRMPWVRGLSLSVWPESEVEWIDAEEIRRTQEHVLSRVEIIEPGFLRQTVGEESSLRNYEESVYREGDEMRFSNLRFRVAGDGKDAVMAMILLVPNDDGTYTGYDTGGGYQRIYIWSPTP